MIFIKKAIPALGDAAFIISAMVSWMAAGLIFTFTATLLIHRLKLGEGTLGYVSSALSFITAIAAGAAAIRRRKKGALYTGLVSALALIIIALTAGLCISGKNIGAGAVLSVVSFTFAGCLCGSVFYPSNRIKPGSGSFSLGKK